MKKRTYNNPNSLANLKLGAESRRSDKQRHCYSIKLKTHKWLAAGGNASLRLDEMVGKILAGELVAVNKVQVLQAEVDRLRAEMKKLKEKS